LSSCGQRLRNNIRLWLWVPARASLGRDDGEQEYDVTQTLLIDVLCSRSDDFNEGIRAFLEKRKPVYIKR